MLQPSPTTFTPRAFDPFPLPAPGGDPEPGFGFESAHVPAAGDGVAPPWWFKPATPTDPSLPAGGFGAPSPWGGGAGAQGNPLYGLIVSLLGALQSLLGSLFGQSAGSAAAGGGQAGGSQASAEQRFRDLDLSSTGDPHLAAVGTRAGDGPAGGGALDLHFDSMSSHRDLLDSADVAGGYRVSTEVSQPDAAGVTTNREATVHANCGRDAITLRGDGSFSVVSNGSPIALGKGGSATLAGGETVRAGEDGSLVVSARGGGGTISTTLRAVDGRVDVTSHAHELAVGGDIVDHGAPPPWWNAHA